MNTTSQIILIEDNPEYRNVIKMALEREKHLALANTFGTAERALEQLSNADQSNHPDLILLDLMLPGMNGTKAVKPLLEVTPTSKILVLSQSDNEAHVVEAIQQGASGYILKSSGISHIKESIQTILEGEAVLDASVAKYIVHSLQNQSTETPGISLNDDLTAREIEILKLLAGGYVKKEIGTQLKISTFTVAAHVRNIYEKLNVPNAPAAVSKAYKKGLL